MTGSTFIKVNHNRFHYLNEINLERRYEKETVRRLMLGLMGDFLPGCSCSECPLEKRMSGSYAYIGSIASPSAVRVLSCSLPLLQISFVAGWMGSPPVCGRGGARWGKQTMLKCHCLSGWVYGRGQAYILGVNLQCLGIQFRGRKGHPCWHCCHVCWGSLFQAGGQAGAAAANLSHLLNNL